MQGAGIEAAGVQPVGFKEGFLEKATSYLRPERLVGIEGGGIREQGSKVKAEPAKG